MVDLVQTQHLYRLTLPAPYLDLDRLNGAIKDLGLGAGCWVRRNEVAERTITIEITSRSSALRTARRVFAHAQGVPLYPHVDLRRVTSARPLLSCIIVLNQNDLFVRDQLIPSLAACTRDVEYEVIVVSNGDADLSRFDDALVVDATEYGCVSKAYNTGVNASRGRYVALFHDDCMVHDPNWARHMMTLLDAGATLTSPEINTTQTGLQVAKGVPLMCKRKTYDRLSGHDEFYFVGLEDIDFTCQARASGGEVVHAPIEATHFNGMSTVLMFSPNAAVLRRLFAYLAIRRRSIRALAGLHLENLRINPVFKARATREYLYLFEKHTSLLEEDYGSRFPGMVERSRSQADWLSRDPGVRSAVNDREALASLYRDLRGRPPVERRSYL